MRKFGKLLILLSTLVFIACNIAIAGGLSTAFVEVKLKGLKPGKVYSIKQETGNLLIVRNNTDSRTLDIAIEPEKPVSYNLVPGYEPIPDTSWITIEDNYFKKVAPGESAQSNIFICIPREKEYKGRKYQVYIYSHTAGKTAFRMGLMSRLLIETE